jgi:hypothetical protein
MLPRQVAIVECGLPCILDVGLSLSPTGLFWTLALARALPVWLPHSHWSIVDDPAFFSRDARLLERLTGGVGAEAVEQVAKTVAIWREARDSLGFGSTPRLFWYEGGPAGSVVPKDGDTGLTARIDRLASGFDGRRTSIRGATVQPPPPDALADCARDTAALAAALGGRLPLILNRFLGDDACPELASQLQAIGIPVVQLARNAVLPAWRSPLLDAFAASGLAVPVAAGQIRLTAMAVVAPRSTIASIDDLSELGGIDQLSWNDDGGAAEAELWDEASAVWWELP